MSLSKVISGIEESISTLQSEIAELQETISQKESHINDLQELMASASSISSQRDIAIVHTGSTAVVS